jgi:hypothetical protein
MRTSTFAAAALLSLLAGCSQEAIPTVTLFPCPAELFSMEPVNSATGSVDEVRARVPGTFAEEEADGTASAEAKPPKRAFIPASFFERSGLGLIVARDLRPLAPAIEDGYAAAGGGVVTRRPATPMLRGPLHLATGDTLATIPRPVGMRENGPRAQIIKEKKAPVLALTQDMIAKTVQSQLPRIRACYERLIKHHPTARGRMVLQWTIRPDGAVEQVEVLRDEIGSEQFQGCASRSVAKWRFPRGVEDVSVSYPFQMTSRSY